jgi:hypothetical protein
MKLHKVSLLLQLDKHVTMCADGVKLKILLKYGATA